MSIILCSSKCPASSNIFSNLLHLGFEEEREGEWVFEKIRMIDTKVDRMINVPTDFKTDYLIVLSSHRSQMQMQSLTVHLPGNWDAADLGGSPRTLNISYSSMQRFLLKKLAEKNKEYGLNFNVNFEVDHHGPTIDKPIIFIEIGSSEKEWSNTKAGRIVAETVFEAITEIKTGNSELETFFAVGGGHYAPKFTALALDKGYAFGHILPKYKADSIAQDTFTQAMEKNLEKVNRILIDDKGVNAAQRDRIKALANEFGYDTLVI